MRKKYLLGMCMAILAVHIALILFYGAQKEGFHEDEYYTYFTSVGNINIDPYGAITEKTGYDVQRQFLVTDENRFCYGAVVDAQEADVHPPLYYLTLNTLMSLFPNRFYKWFGIGLGGLYSLISCCGCILLIGNLDKSRHRYALAGIAGLVYATSPAMISSVMFTRMYGMSAMWTVAYANIFVALMQDLSCSKRRFFRLTAAGGVVCYLSFLTHYFCLIPAFFLTLGGCLYVLFWKKGFFRMLLYSCVMAGSIGLAVLTYPASIRHIFSGYRGRDAVSSLARGGNLFDMLWQFAPILDRNFFGGLMPFAFMLLGLSLAAGIFLLFKRGKEGVSTAYVWTLATLLIGGIFSVWLLSRVSLFVGDVSSRFFYPAGALMLPVMAYCICKACILLWEEWISGKAGILPAYVLAYVLAMVWNIAGLAQDNVLFLYRDKAANVAFSEENAKYPVMVVYGGSTRYRAWYMANELWPFDRVIYVDYMGGEYTLDNETLKTAEKLIVYMDCPEDILEDLIAGNEHLSGYSLARHDPFFYIYEVGDSETR